MKHLLLTFLLIASIISCQDSEEVTEIPNSSASELYFPPINSSTWETKTPESLNWNTANLENLYTFLENGNTRAFLILKDGKIVVEKYFGNDLQGNTFTQNSNWYWASAGKSITSVLVGIAQQNTSLTINNNTSDYLGNNWTSETLAQENLITIKHQLSMTSGLDDAVTDAFCTLPECLTYKASAGTRWAYHNAPYTLLDDVIANVSGTTFQNFSNQELENKIGMNGYWYNLDYNNVYISSARDMARFGLLVLNKGSWDTTAILSDENYYNQMISPSQDLNKSYGYLWWLNGQESFMLPSTQTIFQGKLIPDAPDDMFSAIGLNSQTLDIIPSENLIVVRMGESADNSLVSVTFQRDMWTYLSDVFN